MGSYFGEEDTSGATYFAYNAAGLVARMRWKDASATYFFYDGKLLRYGLVTAGSPTYFLWDGSNLLQELNADGTVKEEHTNARTPVAGIGQLVESYRPSQAEAKIYPVMDSRGTITKWIQSDGTTVLASREYDAFGTIITNSASGTWPSRFGYQGQGWIEIASANGAQRLLLSHTRVYDPSIGRFIQPEPLVERRPSGQYLYSRQNPVDLVDPLGLWCGDEDFGWESEAEQQDRFQEKSRSHMDLDEPTIPRIFDPDYTSPQEEFRFTMGDVPKPTPPAPPVGVGSGREEAHDYFRPDPSSKEPFKMDFTLKHEPSLLESLGLKTLDNVRKELQKQSEPTHGSMSAGDLGSLIFESTKKSAGEGGKDILKGMLEASPAYHDVKEALSGAETFKPYKDNWSSGYGSGPTTGSGGSKGKFDYDPKLGANAKNVLEGMQSGSYSLEFGLKYKISEDSSINLPVKMEYNGGEAGKGKRFGIEFMLGGELRF